MSSQPRLLPATLASLSLCALGAACGGEPAAGIEEGAGPALTYYRDIAPIVQESCLSCHVTGGIAPFPLESYEDAVPVIDLLAEVTASRRMPPWGVDNTGACNRFVDARWLTDAEIATIGAWVDGGAAAGDPADAPPLEEPAQGLSRVDATLDMGVEYVPDATLSDDYRCFVVDPALTSKQYLTEYEVKPGQTATVHHVILFSLDTPEAEAEAVAKDDAEAGPGYTCFGGAGIGSGGDVRFLAGWAPGTPVTRYPEGTGVKLEANRKLVMQIHYNTANGLLPDRSVVKLKLSPRAAEAYIVPIADFDFAAPPGQTLWSTTEEWALDELPIPVTVHGVFPHMHTLGRTLHVELEHEAQSSCVVDVPRWDFHWQQFYFYEQPLTVVPGDKLRITCGFDTSHRSAVTTWGEETTAEMCLDFLYVTLGG